MVTRDYLVQSALRHSHKSVGYAFCKALGVLHLIRRTAGTSTYERRHFEGVLECFKNKANPSDIRYRKEV